MPDLSKAIMRRQLDQKVHRPRRLRRLKIMRWMLEERLGGESIRSLCRRAAREFDVSPSTALNAWKDRIIARCVIYRI